MHYKVPWLSIILAGLLLSATDRGLAQETGDSAALSLVHVFTDSISNFEVDNLGNLYLVGRQQQIKKISPNFDSIAVYNDIRHYGRLHSIDVNNPLKVLLFFRDYGIIIILDRFLNVRTQLNLRTAKLQQVSAITQSYDNNIWVYDELETMVKKIDESGRELVSSPDFRVIFDDPPTPSTLQDFNKFLYAYDPQRGLLVMDYFGAYRNNIPFLGWKNLHGISQGIAGTDSTGLVYYQPGTLQTRHQKLPADILAAKKIRMQNQQLFVLDQQGRLAVYRLQ